MIRLAVIGGGPAGMMAAATAAAAGCAVDLYEKKERLGKKLSLTGNGRCNVTNDCAPEEFFPSVISGGRFLRSAIHRFSGTDMMRYLEGLGLRLKTEENGRVFPASDRSLDVIEALERELVRLNVRIWRNATVLALERTGENAESGEEPYRLTWCVTTQEPKGEGMTAPDGAKEQIACYAAVILATGGLSYPATGSTGDGYVLAERLGHTVTPRYPALTPLVTQESWVRGLQGLSLRGIGIELRDGKKTLFSERGDLLFTHFGVSGPSVLSAGSVCTQLLSQKKLTLWLHLKPDVAEEELRGQLKLLLEENRKRLCKNALAGYLPARLIPVLLEESGIAPEIEAGSLSKKERQRLLEHLQRLPLTVLRTRGYEEAIVTQGGVSTREIDPVTMESKYMSGLYFAGELMDVDARTGGYNLQIAWASGRAAGRAASQRLREK